MIETVTAPTVEPITLADAKLHLRVDGTTEDAYITALITAARQAADHEAQRSFAARTLRLRALSFDRLELSRGPVNAITHVRYIDPAGVQQTVPAQSYYLDRSGLVPVVRLAVGASWPTTASRADVVEVQYTAGTWNVAAGVDTPRSALQYMLLLIGSMYEHREADADRAVARMPWVAALLDPDRIPGHMT